MLELLSRYPFLASTEVIRSVVTDGCENEFLQMPKEQLYQVLKIVNAENFHEAKLQSVLGQKFVDMLAYTEAKECLERAVLLQPNDHVSVCLLAYILFIGPQGVAKDEVRAKKLLEDVLKTGQCHVIVYIFYAHFMFGKEREAKLAFLEPFIKDLLDGKKESGNKLQDEWQLKDLAAYLMYLLVQGPPADMEKAKVIQKTARKHFSHMITNRTSALFTFAAFLLCQELENDLTIPSARVALPRLFNQSEFFDSVFRNEIYEILPLKIRQELNLIKK